MSIHNDISGIFETPLKTQSEIQSSKLNESESRPNIALRRIGQELDKAETKCITLKSELNYMMGVCRKAQTDIKESKETSDISSIISLFKSPDSKSSIEHNDCNSKIKDTLNLTSARFSPKRRIDNYDIIDRPESLLEERQKELLNVTITPRTQLNKKLPYSITTMPTQNENTEADREYETYYFPLSTSFEKLTSNEDYFYVTPNSARRSVEDIAGIGDSRLNLDMPNVTKARKVVKNKSRTGKSEISSIYRTDNSVFKARKRKAKLRNSVSKSTITTKDTGFIGRKEAKRRRHRGHDVVLQQHNPPKQMKKFNDVVEIFHNTRLKNSNSKVSSKHSKVGANGAKYEKKPSMNINKYEKKHSPEIVNREKALVPSPKDRNFELVIHECQSQDKKSEQTPCLQTLNCQNNSETVPEVAEEQDKLEKHLSDLGPSAQDETQLCKRAFSRYDDDSMFMPSYEMPTLASRLKRSNRSYFSRFNFRNIPFVVGTSVTPSYNLGLNIQQVLSVMKTRQPIPSDVTPLLIRKVSKGIRPVSILLNQMNNHCEGSALDVNLQMAGTFNSKENLDRDKKLSAFNLQHVGKTQSDCVSKVSTDAEMISGKENNVSKQLCKEKGDFCDHRNKQQFFSYKQQFISKTNMSASLNQQGISRIPLKDISDHKIHIPNSHNSKEIHDVLINLHDQFEEMNKKYEKLKSDVDKSNDKSLAKELSVLEKELNAKEEEINAVVGLYKEVMTLKQQMKMLHEKNSLVCIASETKGTCKDPFSLSIKSHSMNPAQIFGRRKIYNASREPPASMQLAALLRQIQTFHKQLQLVS